MSKTVTYTSEFEFAGDRISIKDEQRGKTSRLTVTTTEPRTFWQWLLSKPATSRTKVYYGPSWASAFMYSREGEFPAFPEAQAIELHRRAIEDVKYAEQFASDWDAS